jgi:hypothetical protein
MLTFSVALLLAGVLIVDISVDNPIRRAISAVRRRFR